LPGEKEELGPGNSKEGCGLNTRDKWEVVRKDRERIVSNWIQSKYKYSDLASPEAAL
jgi:hypothetical protein